jgi:hypothetical protein
MASASKSPNRAKPIRPENKSELTDEQLTQVAGGTFEYKKPEVVYTPQKPDGTSNYAAGDPDEGGQFHVQTRLR